MAKNRMILSDEGHSAIVIMVVLGVVANPDMVDIDPFLAVFAVPGIGEFVGGENQPSPTVEYVHLILGDAVSDALEGFVVAISIGGEGAWDVENVIEPYHDGASDGVGAVKVVVHPLCDPESAGIGVAVVWIDVEGGKSVSEIPIGGGGANAFVGEEYLGIVEGGDIWSGEEAGMWLWINSYDAVGIGGGSAAI